jgi:hypothetical protein
MTFERTKDFKAVRAILTDPDLYDYMTDDFAPAREAFQVNDHPGIWYVLVSEGSSLYGMFVFLPDNAICWQVHVAFFRGASQQVTRAAGAGIVEWLWRNTPCRRLIASVPACNRAAVRYGVRAMGLVKYGVNEASFMKNGKLWNQVLMGKSCPR